MSYRDLNKVTGVDHVSSENQIRNLTSNSVQKIDSLFLLRDLYFTDFNIYFQIKPLSSIRHKGPRATFPELVSVERLVVGVSAMTNFIVDYSVLLEVKKKNHMSILERLLLDSSRIVAFVVLI